MSLLGLVALTGIALLVNIPPCPLRRLARRRTVPPGLGGRLRARSHVDVGALHRSCAGDARAHARPPRPQRAARWIDWLPGVYVLYVFASIALTTDLLESNVTGTAKAFVLFVAIGSIVYYFLIFGPGREDGRDDHRDPPGERYRPGSASRPRQHDRVERLGLRRLAARERRSARRLDPDQPGPPRRFPRRDDGGCRRGPRLGWARSLRRLSWITLFTAAPGLLLTLTRGPILRPRSLWCCCSSSAEPGSWVSPSSRSERSPSCSSCRA